MDANPGQTKTGQLPVPQLPAARLTIRKSECQPGETAVGLAPRAGVYTSRPAPKPGHHRIPRSRRLTTDVLHFHQQVPSTPHVRRMSLGPLVAARNAAAIRIGWPVLFIKAVGLVCEKFPELRQSWLKAPWPHIYQHSLSIGMLAVERWHEDQPWLFWTRFQFPESRTLDDLQERLRLGQTEPVESKFRRQLQLCLFPSFIRRMLWWWSLNVSGRSRERRAGTFFVTTLGSRGAQIPHPPSMQTVCLSYGPFDEAGCCDVVLSYDHRLMDGSLVAAALEDLEHTLNVTLAGELASLQETQVAQPAA
ncbi:MAG: hypothetical protein KDA79_16685 [Planctomycetaceae bacterium]|nr:hypothetical protein [Planctomycetaceae bacterium]